MIIDAGVTLLESTKKFYYNSVLGIMEIDMPSDTFLTTREFENYLVGLIGDATYISL